jgi:hypothetical protein
MINPTAITTFAGVFTIGNFFKRRSTIPDVQQRREADGQTTEKCCHKARTVGDLSA